MSACQAGIYYRNVLWGETISPDVTPQLIIFYYKSVSTYDLQS